MSKQGWPIPNLSGSPAKPSTAMHAVSLDAEVSPDTHPERQHQSHGASASTSNGGGPPPDTSALRGRFQIPAAEVRRILRDQQISMEELLLELIQPAADLARPYISGFQVGAVGVGGSGAIYVGVNVEFPKTALNQSIHAEQCLMVNCLHHKETELKMIAVSAAPCGHCRQFYAEVANSDNLLIMFGKASRPRLLGELLPLRFGPMDLAVPVPGAAPGAPGAPPFPLLLSQQSHPVAFLRSSVDVTLTARSGDGLFQEAAGEALTEAIQSYSPYTHSPSGVAIITADGQIYSGAYIESAAYNPSLSPFHAAMVAAIAEHHSEYSQIREVILAELPDAPVQHADNIHLMLRAIAPHAVLTVLPLQLISDAPGAAVAGGV